MHKKLLLLLISVFILSCKSDDNSIDCSLVDCFVGENTLYLQFLQPDNDDDLLSDGTIDIDLIKIINENSDEVTFTVEEFSGMGVFLAIPVSTESFGQKSFTIDFEEGDSFTVDFETSYSEGGECCGPYTLVEGFEVDNYSYDLVEPSPLPLFNKIYIESLD